MKTYFLTLSKTFPSFHAKAGERTFFRQKFAHAHPGTFGYPRKYHTIRANYELWAKRFDKIAAGEAVLSVREWIGKPYERGSSMFELAQLTREDGIGIQQLKFQFENENKLSALIDGVSRPPLHILARNDGLFFEDWKSWFMGYDLGKPMAIIHFTKFRY